MRLRTFLAIGFLASVTAAAVVMLTPAQATTPTALVYGQQGALAYIRPCSHKGVTTTTLTPGADGTTGAVGSTGTMTNGTFVVTCSINACYGQGSTAVAAIALTPKTACNQVTANVPYWFLSESSDFIAVTGATGSASGGTCSVTECR